MYSFLPDNFIITGIYKKEFKYSDCEETARLNPDIIKAALSVNKTNVDFIPDKFWIEKSKDKHFNVKEFLQKHPLSLTRYLQVSLLVPCLKNQLDDVNFLLTKVIFPDETCNPKLDLILDKVHKIYPEAQLFNNPDYLVSIIHKFEKNKKFKSKTSKFVYYVYENLSPTKEKEFLDNYKILAYVLSFFSTEDLDNIWKIIPNNVLNNRDQLITLFETIIKLDISLNIDIDNFLCEMKKSLIKDKEVLTTTFKMLINDAGYFDISWLSIINISFKNKDELELLKELILFSEKNNIKISLLYFTEYFSLGKILKNSPTLMEFLIAKPEWLTLLLESIDYQLITAKEATNILNLMKPENVKPSDLSNVYQLLRSYFKDQIDLKNLEGTKMFPNINKLGKDKDKVTVYILKELSDEILEKVKLKY